MLLMPITRPCASASGPPELPGASRTSARTHACCRGPSVEAAAWTTPVVSAPYEAERVADREDDFTDAERIGIPDHRRREIGRINLKRGEIALRRLAP